MAPCDTIACALAVVPTPSTIVVVKGILPATGNMALSLPAGLTLIGGFTHLGDAFSLDVLADRTQFNAGSPGAPIFTLGAGSVVEGFDISSGVTLGGAPACAFRLDVSHDAQVRRCNLVTSSGAAPVWPPSARV